VLQVSSGSATDCAILSVLSLTGALAERRCLAAPGASFLGFAQTRQISTQSAETIAQAAQQFGQDDDITVLTLTLAPAEVLHA
jgi:hypothetical protein